MEKPVDDYFTSCVEEKLKTEIAANYNTFQRMNDKKRTEYMVSIINRVLVDCEGHTIL